MGARMICLHLAAEQCFPELNTMLNLDESSMSYMPPDGAFGTSRMTLISFVAVRLLLNSDGSLLVCAGDSDVK